MILLLALALTQDPVAVDERVVIELVARDPDLATPTGIAVDPRGRIWVVENNTHMRPKDYKGRPTDRILIFDDFGPDGRARKITTFSEGFRHGMGLAWRGPGDVILVTRYDIARLRDLDGDDRVDERVVLVRLDTTGTYDHNGLFGPAFDGLGDLYFGLGGNTSGEFPFGAPYTIVGSDGSTHAEDEGGRIFKCRADGSKVTFVAKGFWNPFHLAFDGLGRLFAVDNDPDERPPCRLLHVVSGGDFGFRRRNGGRGLHPFTSWDGEIPGTLPMVAGTGEAPSGIVAHEDSLLVTAWGDHEIQRFRLAARGASFSSRAETVIRGGESFRPVGIAVAPDGSVCISDWVDRSYPVHGKGALWRIRPRKSNGPRPAAPEGPRARLEALWAGRESIDQALRDRAGEVRGEAARLLPAEDPRRRSLSESDPSPFVRLQALVDLRVDAREAERLLPFLAGSDPFLASAATSALSRLNDGPSLARHLSSGDPKIRLGVLLALRLRTDKAGLDPALTACLRDPDPRVRRAAIQWVGEERRADLLPAANAAASQAPVTLDLFLAFLAAQDFQNAKDRRQLDDGLNESFAAALVEDAGKPPLLRAFALRHLPPGHASLTSARLEELLAGGDESLRLEAARALASTPGEAVQERLRTLASDRRAPASIRAEAIAGLSASASRSATTRRILLEILGAESGDLRLETLQALGGVADAPEVRKELLRLVEESSKDLDFVEKLGRLLRPAAATDWKAAAKVPGDPAAGERVFFHPRGPQCFVCHRVNGRGGELGPDLTYVGRALNAEKLVESILDPSREVAPYFLGWEVVTRDGDTLTGRILKDAPDSLRILGGRGVRMNVKKADIADRRPMRASLMPEGLHTILTSKEFRDLVSYLAAPR